MIFGGARTHERSTMTGDILPSSPRPPAGLDVSAEHPHTATYVARFSKCRQAVPRAMQRWRTRSEASQAKGAACVALKHKRKCAKRALTSVFRSLVCGPGLADFNALAIWALLRPKLAQRPLCGAWARNLLQKSRASVLGTTLKTSLRYIKHV